MTATTIQGKIAEALLARVMSLSVASPTWPVEYPDGTTFTPPADGKYLRVDFLPNKPSAPGLSNTSRIKRQGILQITIVVPPNRGIIPTSDIAQAIADHFPRGLSLANDGVTVSIKEPSWPSGAFVAGDKQQMPVSIPWVAFTAS
jgi:hypothetical protein